MTKTRIRLYLIALILLAPAQGYAVHRASNGLGQVLIYPYYTTRADQATLFSVTNSSDSVKALKMRFHEGKGGAPVLDLHLYLAPKDTWIGAMIEDQGVATLFMPEDRSCMVPPYPQEGIPINNVLYLSDEYEDGSLERGGEGYAILIEMGTVEFGEGQLGQLTHSFPGEESECPGLVEAWDPGGVWSNDPYTDITPPTGGLRGSQTIIDVLAGHATENRAVALADFRESALHVRPSGLGLDLSDAEPPVSRVLWEGQWLASTWSEDPVMAVSAVLSTARFSNEFVRDMTTRSESDWVFSQPTKGLHVPNFGGPMIDPYDHTLITAGGQCLEYGLSLWDRATKPAETSIICGVCPPIPIRAVCWATTVFTFNLQGNTSQVLQSPLLATGMVTHQSQNGWGTIHLDTPQLATPRHTMESDEGHRYVGLPGIGFSFTTYNNGIVDNALRSYGVTYDHLTQQRIEIDSN